MQKRSSTATHPVTRDLEQGCWQVRTRSLSTTVTDIESSKLEQPCQQQPCSNLLSSSNGIDNKVVRPCWNNKLERDPITRLFDLVQGITMTPLLAVVGLIAKFTSIFNDFPPSKTRQPLIITKESGKKCHINLFLIISLTIILILTAHNALTNGRENTVHFKAAIYMKLWHFTNSQDTHSNKHFHTVCELSLVSPKLYHLHDILGRYKQLFVLDLIQEEQETSLTETPSRLYDGRITVRFSATKIHNCEEYRLYMYNSNSCFPFSVTVTANTKTILFHQTLCSAIVLRAAASAL